LKSICVYCGSSAGADPVYADAAREVGQLLAESGLRMVYGGGRVGLMGLVADAALTAGGTVIGVIPQALADKEIAHANLTEMIVVSSMHERKAKMAELSDGFLALPGGFGTWEEFCEMVTWGQLGMHPKPCGLLNAAGFYDPLLLFFDHAAASGFVRPEHRAMALSGSDPHDVLAQMQTYQPPTVPKWRNL
jgi:uncharacterized protein (TIGR00730 family)